MIFLIYLLKKIKPSDSRKIIENITNRTVDTFTSKYVDGSDSSSSRDSSDSSGSSKHYDNSD